MPDRLSIHEPRLFFLEPFPPGVKGIFCQALFFAELLHGGSAPLLRGDSFAPLVGLGAGRLLLDVGVGHDSTMQRLPARTEEGFFGHLPVSAKAILEGQPCHERNACDYP
jgi:hypothetical protein